MMVLSDNALAPIELRNFDDPDAGVRLSFRMPIMVTPELDESGTLLLLDYEQLHIHVHACTRAELEDSLYGWIWFTWETYVRAPDCKFSTAARDFKSRLMNAIEEAPLG